VPLQGDTFLIDYYPVKLSLSDFLLVGITVLAIGILASWIPSKKAAAQVLELRN
jgi:lipoprotein-releasing system permease protein